MQVLRKVLSKSATLVILSLLGGGNLIAQSGEIEFKFEPPVVEHAVFGKTVSMLAQERADYAKNLSNYAANRVQEIGVGAGSLHIVRKLLAVALHLSPRSKDALVVSHQLQQGLIPEKRTMDYTPEVFARLLLTRAELLYKQDDPGERMLARSFIDLAAMIDPRNEDAVYAFQIQMIDHGELDWDSITDAKKTVNANIPSP